MLNLTNIWKRSFSSIIKDAVKAPVKNKSDLKSPVMRVKDLLCLPKSLENSKYSINGWVTQVRKMKNLTFLSVNDGSCKDDLQIIVPQKLPSEFNVGSSVKASGALGTTPKGQIELQVSSIDLVNTCKYPEYPLISKQQHLPQYVREFLHLRTRHKPFAATMRVRHSAQKAFHTFFDKEGFFNIHTPILTSNDCEDSGEVFLTRPDSDKLLQEMQREGVTKESSYFDKKSFLTVSGQLHLEAMCLGLDKVFNFNPAFRAENSKSPCHLAEFWMIEGEIAFMDQILDLTSFVESMIKNVTKNTLNSSAADINYLIKCNEAESKEFDSKFKWIDKKFPVISYQEALNILEAHSGQIKIPVKASEGLAKNHEQFLTKHLDSPCFVAYFPKEIKPFYMKSNAEFPNLVDCFDFLVPEIGELVGGSVREFRLDALLESIPNKKDLEWYTDLRKYGSACTSGFGLGFERYLQWLLNVKNIRDVISFPRWPHNCDT
uniref:asparagine--tRNA ligase n=1 Tax=Culicoides sonorensis TaxID=179676 RepID=A0A336L653_CULSO